MLSLRAHVIICGSLFAAIIVFAVGGNVLQAAGVKASPALRWPVMILFFGLFLAFVFSIIPVMVKLVLGAQRAVGNADLPAVKAALRLETVIIWVMWGLMAAGLAVALPAMVADGFFGAGPKHAMLHPSPGPSQGVLAGKPGMTLAELAQASTLPLAEAVKKYPSGPIGGGAVFDFRIPGSSIVFPQCRYYYVTTSSRDRERIEGMSIGTSPTSVSRAEVDAADAELRGKLAADGWLTGHEVYRTEEDQQLHGGRTEGPAGDTWLKDGVILDIRSKRMDDAKPGEDATAGEWIQFVELWALDTYSGAERMDFGPWKP